MRTLVIAALAVMVSAAGTDAWQKGQKERKPVTHTVTVDATGFSPASLTITAGDSVLWVNKDLIPHTATSKKAGVFDSGAIAAGRSWKQTMKTRGELPYVCEFHPTMKGTLIVK